jgi:hypothetical protein
LQLKYFIIPFKNPSEIPSEILNPFIPTKEILKRLAIRPNGKRCGPDDLTVKFWKSEFSYDEVIKQYVVYFPF